MRLCSISDRCRHYGRKATLYKTLIAARQPSESSQDSESETTSPSTSAPPTTFQPPPCICSWPRTGSGCCPTLSNLSDTSLTSLPPEVFVPLGSQTWRCWGKGCSLQGKKIGGPLSPSLCSRFSGGAMPAATPPPPFLGALGWAWCTLGTTEGTVRTSR